MCCLHFCMRLHVKKGFLAKPSLETTARKGAVSNEEQRMLLVLLLRFRGAEERSRFPSDLPAPAGSSRPLSWADAAAWLHLEDRELIFPLNSEPAASRDGVGGAPAEAAAGPFGHQRRPFHYSLSPGGSAGRRQTTGGQAGGWTPLESPRPLHQHCHVICTHLPALGQWPQLVQDHPEKRML